MGLLHRRLTALPQNSRAADAHRRFVLYSPNITFVHTIGTVTRGGPTELLHKETHFTDATLAVNRVCTSRFAGEPAKRGGSNETYHLGNSTCGADGRWLADGARS